MISRPALPKNWPSPWRISSAAKPLHYGVTWKTSLTVETLRQNIGGFPSPEGSSRGQVNICFRADGPRGHVCDRARWRFPFDHRHGRIVGCSVGRSSPAVPRTRLRFAADGSSFGATSWRDLDMGAIAEAFVAYAQPLLSQTDGSQEQLEKALAVSQFCYNLAMLPQDSRDEMLSNMRASLAMDDEEFDDFRRSIVVPMVRRHEEMFPQMHRRGSAGFSPSGPSPSGPSPSGPSLRASPRTSTPTEASPGTDRYAPCPCNSGKKYKFCCGKKVPKTRRP